MSERKNAARRAARGYTGPRDQRVKLAVADPTRCDIMFSPGLSPDGRTECGWIAIDANEKGREAMQRIFPKARFNWHSARDGGPVWDGWQQICPHLPDVAAVVANALPANLLRLKPLHEATDSALCWLMAVAAHDQGVTPCFLTMKNGKPQFGIYAGPTERPAGNVLNMPLGVTEAKGNA